jgi:acyl carrier protein
MTRNKLKNLIVESLNEVAAIHDTEIHQPLQEDTVLLDSGLDSLGFATLVARLEMSLEYDPFANADEAYYPASFGEFIDYYHNNKPTSDAV